MNDEEMMQLYNKFKEFARKEGYTHPIPDNRIGFMNTKSGDVMVLRGKREANVIKKNEITEADMV